MYSNIKKLTALISDDCDDFFYTELDIKKDKNEIKQLLTNDYSDAYNLLLNDDNRTIYRGIYFDDNKDILISKSVNRISKTYNNILNSLCEILPSWSNLPKRNSSNVGIPNMKDAEDYGNVYIMLPINNALMSYSNYRDFHDISINKIKKLENIKNYYNLFDLNDSLYEIFNAILILNNRLYKSESNILRKVKSNDLKNIINIIEKIMQDKNSVSSIRNIIKTGESAETLDIFDFLFSNTKYSLLKKLDDLLMPSNLNVYTFNYNNIKNINPNQIGEIWTEDKCLLIRNDEDVCDIIKMYTGIINNV